MAPQDDLTAERAAAIRLYENIFAMSPDTEAMEAGDDCQYEAIARALRTARQEALREGAKVAREFPWEQPSAHADPLRQARCRGNREASSDIAAALDRLASEGG